MNGPTALAQVQRLRHACGFWRVYAARSGLLAGPARVPSPQPECPVPVPARASAALPEAPLQNQFGRRPKLPQVAGRQRLASGCQAPAALDYCYFILPSSTFMGLVFYSLGPR